MNAQTDRPNVLMFIPHDLGDYLHCYGHDTVRSPNLDRLAGQGVRLSEHFVAAAECTPSRAGLYTGLFNHQTGLMGLVHFGWEFDPQASHLAKLLWNSGYDTHLFGHQHETRFNPSCLGYNRIHSQLDRTSQPVCGEVAEFLANQAGCQKKPWFACVGFTDVHRAWKCESTFSPDEVEVPPYLPDNPQVRKDLTLFHQAIENMDASIGIALKALDKSGLAENTLVVFTADHGSPFPRAKSTYYDPGIRVPMILRWPDGFAGEKVYDQLISNMDYCPTILDACGVKIPDGLEGRSYLPLLQGKAYEGRNEVFGAFYYDACYDPMLYVRTKRYKYIRSFAVTPDDCASADPDVLTDHKTGSLIRADDLDVQSSLTWKSMKGPFDRPEPEELYDFETDPNEQNNLIDDDKYSEVLENLRATMQAMMERTDCPLLDGGHVSPELSSTRNRWVGEFKARRPQTKNESK